jgi:transposase
VRQARLELAAEFTADLRRFDAQLCETRKKLAVAVRASGTSLTEVFGIGPVIAATVIGDVRDVSRFASRDRFAAYDGTAPIEVSSGNRKSSCRSRRGNRRLNHVIHRAAVTQIRYRHSDGRAYYDKKIAEGKTGKEALRALKRQISDAIYKHLTADAARAAARSTQGPGGQPGNDSVASAARLTPRTPALRPSHSRTCHQPYDAQLTSRKGPAHAPGKRPPEPLDKISASLCAPTAA